MHAVKDTLAERIQDGVLAESLVEDKIDEFLGFDCLRIGSDDYDNSLEVYLGADAPAEWRTTPEFTALVLSMGFSKYWVNWPDQTEQFMENPRKAKAGVTNNKAPGNNRPEALKS